MFRIVLLVLVAAMPLASQIAVTPLRIGGLSPTNWSNGDGGPAIDALLTPTVLAWDRAGNLLIADNLNRSIRQMTPDGTISTLFNQAGVYGMAVDSQNNVYVSVGPSSYTDAAHIFEFSPSGGKAEIPNPVGSVFTPAIAIDAADNLYIAGQTAELNGFVWRRSPSGALAVIAGKAGPLGPTSPNGPALQATLSSPHALAFDNSSNLLIADNDGIIRLYPDGTVLSLYENVWIPPSRIAPAADGSVYFIGDYYGIWQWSGTGGITLFAGNQQPGFSDGCALSGGKRVAKYASFSPSDLIFDTAGRLYVADSIMGGRIRRIDPDGSIRTVAGAGSMPHESAPGAPALGAIFHNPEALALDRAGNIFFAESSANHVHEITAAGQFLLVAGADSPPAEEDPACYNPAGSDVLSAPRGIATDAAGNLYISDTGNNRILRRSADGTITTIAGTGVAGQSGDGGPAVEAQISGPTAIAVKPDDSIYFVSDGNVRSIATGGIIQSAQTPEGITWLAVGFDGRLILNGSQLYKETSNGVFYALRGGVGELVADSAGAIYGIANPLVRISPNCNFATLTFPQGLIAQFPQGLGSDALGSIYLSADNSVWSIAAVTGPAVDSPTIYLDDPGVFNAASNLVAYSQISQPCFHECGPYAMNDSVTGNEILHITGGCLGPLMPSQASDEGGQLPTEWQETRVLINGEAAPLLRVQATEILAIAPQDVASKTTVTLVVQNQSVAAASVVIGVATAVPGIFVSSGTQAAAINEDGTLNGADHPAAAGSIVALFLTGAGLTDPPTIDGVLPGLPLAQLALPVTATVGGTSADVVYAGSAFGLPGVAQLNIRVPTVAASDAVPVQVAIGGNSRDQVATIAIQ